jgi:hypothetical protein
MLPSSASAGLDSNSQRISFAVTWWCGRRTAMNDAGFLRRLEMLEETVESLKRLPDRVGALEVRVGSLESQVLQLRTEMRDGFSAIERRMATKDDLTGFATKEDLGRFATKEDLGRFATKEDLGRFATKEDLERLAAATKDDFARMASKDDLSQLGRELREDMSGAVREMAGFVLATERRLLERIPVLVEDALTRIAIRNEGNPGTP